MHVESKLRKPLITGGKSLSDVSEDISIIETLENEDNVNHNIFLSL